MFSLLFDLLGNGWFLSGFIWILSIYYHCDYQNFKNCSICYYHSCGRLRSGKIHEVTKYTCILIAAYPFPVLLPIVLIFLQEDK